MLKASHTSRIKIYCLENLNLNLNLKVIVEDSKAFMQAAQLVGLVRIEAK